MLVHRREVLARIEDFAVASKTIDMQSGLSLSERCSVIAKKFDDTFISPQRLSVTYRKAQV
jgi:hypothetical protein